jgi:hypothetical protein
VTLHAVTALRCTLSTGAQVLFRRCRLTKLSNVVAYACRSPHRKERHHVHSRRRFAGPSAYTASWLSRSHTASEALSARVIAGEREGTRACAGRVRWAAVSASGSIPPLRSTTSPSHCFAMAPTLFPAARRRGALSEICRREWQPKRAALTALTALTQLACRDAMRRPRAVDEKPPAERAEIPET